ncbi:hypothetical protein CEXT_271151 [Caerostris extrusa]|uniref:Uncharacterized protein n=1 Tax=Caerostris extrusa TaxID=172846 RepID=A0AAV4WNQ1_CAEEX|nr:hypothetical protein CEXT_271151 [Caerostris extrusa]
MGYLIASNVVVEQCLQSVSEYNEHKCSSLIYSSVQNLRKMGHLIASNVVVEQRLQSVKPEEGNGGGTSELQGLQSISSAALLPCCHIEPS